MTANGAARQTSGRVSGLEIAGSRKGSFKSRHTFDLAGIGNVVVLGGERDGIAAIKVKLTRDYLGMRAGTSAMVAFASAAASDAVAGTQSSTGQPATRPAPGSPARKPGAHHTATRPGPGASPPPPPAHRVPPQVRLGGGTACPGVVARLRHVQGVAGPGHRPLVAVVGDEAERQFGGLAK